MKKTSPLTATAITLTLALPAFAQDHGQAAQSQGNTTGESRTDVIALTSWNYDEIYAQGWSAEELVDEVDVIGADGEEIGDIENILVDADGNILSVIAEVGGFLDIGDTHVAVPWDQVELGADLESITVPVDQENVEDYSLFGEWGYFTKPEAESTEVVNDDLLTGPRVWKTSELIGDYVLLEGGVNYGYVEDLVFDDQGMLQAVVVQPDVAYGVAGPYAFPYYGYGYGFYPGHPYYALPYGETDIAALDPFDYELMDDEVAQHPDG